MLRRLRRLWLRLGGKVAVTIPAGFREGDVILRPDGWYERVGDGWRKL